MVFDGVAVSLDRAAGSKIRYRAGLFCFSHSYTVLVPRDAGRSFDGRYDDANYVALHPILVPPHGEPLLLNPPQRHGGGCKADGMDLMGPGVFTRGILVDIPLLKGVEYLEPGTHIYPEDLEAWEKFAHVKISSGDVVLVRTGRWARRAKLGPWNVGREAAGLDASTMPWFKQRDISLLGGDGGNDVQPSGVQGQGEAAGRPVHTLTLAVMGVPLVDHAYLEDAAKEAARRKRWEFLTTRAFTRIPGGTATPFNALATF